MTDRELILEAYHVLPESYVPYSGFHVAAALLCRDGKVYTGINIENAAYPATVCAERSAFFRAVNEGEREFIKIAVVGGKNGIVTDYCPPCGVCRQVMREFCDPSSFQIILAKSEEEITAYTLEELLPLSFGPNHLEK